MTKDSSLLTANGSLSLPPFDNLNKQKFFIDIYLSKNKPLQWTSSVSDNCIRLTKSSGSLSLEEGNKEQRIWVDIDWSKIPKNEKFGGAITFAAGDKKMVVNVQANHVKNPLPAVYKGFIEDNGFVSIQASHFSRKTDKPQNHWKVIDGLGYAGSVLQALPLSINARSALRLDSIQQFNSFVEYDFYSFSAASPVINVFALPTHALNNNFSVRFAVSVDNGPLKTLDIKTFGRSEEWKQNVLRNRAERKIEMPFLNSGKHTLKIYTVDPGVMIDEIRIDLGGLKRAYSIISETKILP